MSPVWPTLSIGLILAGLLILLLRPYTTVKPDNFVPPAPPRQLFIVEGPQVMKPRFSQWAHGLGLECRRQGSRAVCFEKGTE